MFRATSCSSSGGQIVLTQHTVSLLSVSGGPNRLISLVNDQLEAKFFYFIIRLLQYSTCFEQRRAHHQEVKLY